MGIVREKAVYGAPDLVIEIVSPNDRASDIVALETDYRNIGVPEIVFIDAPKRRVRILRRQADDYIEEIVTTGTVALVSPPGMRLETEWLFAEPRTAERETVDRLKQAVT
jgi:Uma2 family endonuclease